MDPVMRAWMFHNWIEDFVEDNKLLDNQGYLIGSFINPELVKKILSTDTFTSNDEEFEELSKRIAEQNRSEDKSLKKRKRKLKLKG